MAYMTTPTAVKPSLQEQPSTAQDKQEIEQKNDKQVESVMRELDDSASCRSE